MGGITDLAQAWMQSNWLECIKWTGILIAILYLRLTIRAARR